MVFDVRCICGDEFIKKGYATLERHFDGSIGGFL